MKERSVIRPGILLLLLPLGPLAAAPPGVATLNEAFVRALKGGDLEAIARMHDPGAVLFPPGETDHKGLEAIRFKWGRLLKANVISDASFADATYVSSGDLSAGWGHVRLTLRPKSGEEPVTISGRFSTVARKKDGKWLYLLVSVGELDEVLTFEHYSKAVSDTRR